MEKETARNVTDAEHSPIGRVQVGTDYSNLDGKGAGVATEMMPKITGRGKMHYHCISDKHVIPVIKEYISKYGNAFSFTQLVEYMNLDPFDTHALMMILYEMEEVRMLNYHFDDSNYPLYSLIV